MRSNAQRPEILAFCISIALVAWTIAIFSKRRSSRSSSVKEWGLGGGHLSTVVTWFLVGGEFYTAYTMIAVPALMYSTGGAGFFALPYTTLVYPFVYATMPRLWTVCKRHNLLTAADFVRLRYGSTALSTAIALTGVFALLPYIALQLQGLQSISVQMGMVPNSGIFRVIPVAFAAVVLAAYICSAGLKAPTMIAFAKDTMIYIVVLAAVIVLPLRIGSYQRLFHGAENVLHSTHSAASIILLPSQYAAYATLALGSALAAFLYPHTTTSVLASRSGTVIRRNAYLLPAYTLLLGLIAILGLGALALGIRVQDSKQVVPALLESLFSPWFAGFCFAAIALAALMPAAMMSIAAANLLSRNIYLAFFMPAATDQQQVTFAKKASVIVLAGALAFSVALPTHYMIDLQLLGGIWILQTLPSIIIGLWSNWFDPRALLVGWLASIATGTWFAISKGTITSMVVLRIAGGTTTVYIGIAALVLNLALSVFVSQIIITAGKVQRLSAIVKSDFCDM